MLLQLQKHIVYGPVHSRRLGRSLGINLLPCEVKVCTFNCLYCQYGWTDFSCLESASFPNPETVLENVAHALRSLTEPPAYITFSGNGEPTLHPDFPSIVDGIIAIRDEYAARAKTAILSNASTGHRPPVQRALAKLDVRIMKLDAGDPATLHSYNQPAPGVAYDAILQGLERLADVTVQSLFTAGPAGNDTPENLRAWIEHLKRIGPRRVQIYSLDRGHPSRHIQK